MDGYGRPEQIAERLIELGHSACAITDHGGVFGHVPCGQEYKRLGIKPIFGCEFYICDDISVKEPVQPSLGYKCLPHITVLAKTQKGYENLLRLSKLSYEQGFYSKPRIDHQLLFRNQEGLIVLSGCPGGYPTRKLITHGYNSMLEHLNWCRERIENYFVEIVPQPGWELSHNSLPSIIYAAMQLQIPLVCTGDCHFPRHEDHFAQDALLAVGLRTTIDDATRELRLPEYQYYCSAGELFQRLRGVVTSDDYKTEWLEQAIDNSFVIAEQCEVELAKAKPVSFPGIPQGQTSADLLWQWIRDGAKSRSEQGLLPPEKFSQYIERAIHEFKVLKEKGFCDYILAIADVIKWMKAQDCLIMTRGSAGGCLLLWLLGASETDPIELELNFERFYDATRTDPPDVDIDFEQARREQAIEYIYNKYGRANCSQIAALSRLGPRGAVQDACSALGIHRSSFSSLSEAINDKDTDMDRNLGTVTDPKARQLLDNNPTLVSLIKGMAGQYRHSSVHAAGVLVSSEALDKVIGIIMSGDKPIAAVDKYGAASMGFLKIDMLSVQALDVVGLAARRAKGNVDWLYQLPRNDPNVFKTAKEGRLAGIFQLDGATAKRALAMIGADTFDDIVAASVLCRPGCEPFIPQYRQHKYNPSLFNQFLANTNLIAANILSKTFGVLMYQEQVMRMAAEMAGLEEKWVHRLRKDVGNKVGLDPIKGDEWRSEWYQRFVVGAIQHAGITQQEAEHWWEIIQHHGGYCVFGDTVVIRAGSGKHGGGEITVADLYTQQESRQPLVIQGSQVGNSTIKTPIAKKMRAGKLGLLQMDADGRVRTGKLKKVYHNGVKACCTITTHGGKSITVSLDHRLLTDEGYIEANKIKTCHSLVIMSERQPSRPNYDKDIWLNTGERGTYIRQSRLLVEARARQGCEECGCPEEGRFEVAHIKSLEECEGDVWKFHSPDNLKWLCNSCHKRLDYLKGERHVRWSQGLPTKLDKVISNVFVGLKEVYDIEMNDIEHNFIANGIVSHNSFNKSHATTYGIIGYWMLYLKTYYPAQFYEAYLQLEQDDVVKKRLIYEFKKSGGTVSVLDPHYSKESFTSVGSTRLVGGFSDLKFIGPALSKKVLDKSPFSDIHQLLSALPKRTRDLLDKAGITDGWWDPQCLIQVAPWMPVPEIHPIDLQIKQQHNIRSVGEMPDFQVDGDMTMCGYVTLTKFEKDRVILTLEDDKNMAICRVAGNRLKTIGVSIKDSISEGDFVAIQGWWTGDTMFIKGHAMLRKWKP